MHGTFLSVGLFKDVPFKDELGVILKESAENFQPLASKAGDVDTTCHYGQRSELTNVL